MLNYIDIHSHILPGVDDGARDMEQTRQMLAMAYREGCRVMIATPHFEAGRPRKKASELKDILELVRAEASSIGEDFRIELGNELLFSYDIPDALKRGDALTIAGTRYILVEFTPGAAYSSLKEGLRSCVLSGYIPILAHAERYQCLLKHPEDVEELIQAGTYIQLNLSSINGGFLNPAARFCNKLIDRDLVHFIGTDAHGVNSRPPLGKEVISSLYKKYGEALTNRLIRENPERMLTDKHL